MKVTNFLEEIITEESTKENMAFMDKFCIGLIILASLYFIGHLVVAYLNIPW